MRVLVMLALVLLVPLVFAFWCSVMPGSSHEGPLPALTAEESSLVAEVEGHVRHLAGAIGERSTRKPEGLQASVEYLESVFAGHGLSPRRQTYTARTVEVHNVEVELPGTTLPDEMVVVGAHYDSVEGTVGADDNASGTAALLALARLLQAQPLPRTVRLVAFVNEEPPYFQNRDMGSLRYAERCRAAGDDVVAMFSLESLGYYDDTPGTQKYPAPFGLLYPSQGNFLGFVGNLDSRAQTRDAVRIFRETTAFPAEGLAAPAWVNGVDFSDHWSFWQEGYPGVMVTDTAVFRNPGYHLMEDHADAVDYERLARVTLGILRVVRGAAGG